MQTNYEKVLKFITYGHRHKPDWEKQFISLV